MHPPKNTHKTKIIAIYKKEKNTHKTKTKEMSRKGGS